MLDDPGVLVSLKDDGTPKAGIAVTVALSDGYSFSSGGTSYTGTTGSNGDLTLPDINVPQNGGNSTITATASGARSASASLAATATYLPIYLDNGNKLTASGIPSNSTPLGGAMFLTSDGRLLDGANNGRLVTSNVAAVGKESFTVNETWVFPLRKTDGTCTLATHGDVEAATTGVPSGSTPAVGSFFLSSTIASSKEKQALPSPPTSHHGAISTSMVSSPISP